MEEPPDEITEKRIGTPVALSLCNRCNLYEIQVSETCVRQAAKTTMVIDNQSGPKNKPHPLARPDEPVESASKSAGRGARFSSGGWMRGPLLIRSVSLTLSGGEFAPWRGDRRHSPLKMASACMSLPGACSLRITTAAAAPSRGLRSSASFLGRALQTPPSLQQARSRRCSVVVRAEEAQEVQQVQEEEEIDTTVTEAIGLSRETGGQWLSCTTRHVRLYAGVIDPESALMDQSQLDKLTLMLDPDNEFEWPEEATEKVYDKFRELIDIYEGADLTEYTLRLIGSDLEHYIRKLLLAGELKYNLDCRVLNFSMGKPRMDPAELDDVEVEEL